VARPLEFKKRVRMREDAPVELPARRLPPLALPVFSYWLFSGLVIYGIASGTIPFRRWLETVEQPDPSAIAALEVETPELRADSEPTAPEATTLPVPEPEPPPRLAAEAPPLVEAPIESPEPARAIPTQPAPAPKVDPGPLAALHPPPAALPREKRLSVSGSTDGSALAWRIQRDPFIEPLPALESPEPDRGRSPPEPQPKAKPRRELVAEDEPREPPRREPPPPAVAAGSSCEAAVAAYNEEMDLKGGRRAADLPREAFAAVLDRGTYLSSCGVPDTMKVDICAAVQRGRAVGVTVVTRPANGRVQACVARAVRSLRFPSHPKLDVAKTRFE
jgi:hypothetical protein